MSARTVLFQIGIFFPANIPYRPTNIKKKNCLCYIYYALCFSLIRQIFCLMVINMPSTGRAIVEVAMVGLFFVCGGGVVCWVWGCVGVCF